MAEEQDLRFYLTLIKNRSSKKSFPFHFIVLVGLHFTEAVENVTSKLRRTVGVKYMLDFEFVLWGGRGENQNAKYLNFFLLMISWNDNILDVSG